MEPEISLKNTKNEILEAYEGASLARRSFEREEDGGR